MHFTCISCLLSTLVIAFGADPPGHLQPLGSHDANPKQVDELEDFPHPVEFFDTYIKPGKPAVFKSVLKKNGFKPYKEWDDKYLRENFGRTIIDVEHGKKENRESGLESMPFRRFLQEYADLDVYMVQDLSKAMRDDVSMPYSLRCGSVKKMLTKVIMWFSSGGTKSVLHMDEFDNINCLLDGTKTLHLFDKMYGADIEADGFVWEGSYSSVDVDSVDMYQFRRLQGLPTYKVQLEPGDCLFIPSRWYHQVNSFGNRNLAINLWFYHVHWFNHTDCDDPTSWQNDRSINDFGFANFEEGLRDMVLFPLADLEGDLSKDDFLERWRDISIDNEENKKLFKFMDKNKDGSIQWNELYSVGVEELFRTFPKAFGNDYREQYRQRRDMALALQQQEAPQEGVTPKTEL